MLFCNRLGSAIRRAHRAEREPFAVMVLDLDHLKTVNDSLGHSVGDQLLVAVAQRLAGTISGRDTLTHLGGDEFALLVEGCGSSDDAVQAADRVHAALRRPFQLDGHEVFVSVSIGIALGSAGHQSPEECLRDADTAMYRAKAPGTAGMRSSTRGCIHGPSSSSHWRTTCAAPSRGASSGCTINRSSAWRTGRSKASRPWRADSTPSAGCCTPTRSFRSRRRRG